MSDEQVEETKPTAWGIFKVAFHIGLFSLGGAMAAWLHRELVVKRGWMDERSFQTDLGLARMLPGTNVSNFLTIGGFRMAGIRGAAAGLAGILIAPFFMVVGLAFAYNRISGPILGDLLQGAAAAALGFLIPMVFNSVKHIARRKIVLIPMGLVAVAVGVGNLPLAICALIALPFSVALVLFDMKRNA